MLTQTLFTLAAAGIPLVSAHMLMADPKPFASIAQDQSPLHNAADNPGAPGNYPCKFDGSSGFYDATDRTTITAGDNHTASFIGSAVHGGGSCQFSISKDLKPTADSEFKVLLSVEGSCPSTNIQGNLPGGPSTPDPTTFGFQMHPQIPKGDYTFAWTWFNRMGNREMYMVCAPITVTNPSGGDDGYYESLPNIAVANINNDPSCTGPPEDSCYQFQDPGKFLETNPCDNADPSAKQNYAKPGKVCTAPLSGGSGAPPAPPSPPSNPSPPPTGEFPPTPPAPAPPAPAPAPPTGGAPPCANPCTGSSIQCIGANQFGQCSNGCMTPMPVAAGMTCQNGQMVAATAPGKRHARRGFHVFPIASPSPVSQPSMSSPSPVAPVSTPGSCANPCDASKVGIVCMGETQFAQCADGCLVSRPVAAGTKCQNNGIVAVDGGSGGMRRRHNHIGAHNH